MLCEEPQQAANLVGGGTSKIMHRCLACRPLFLVLAPALNDTKISLERDLAIIDLATLCSHIQ